MDDELRKTIEERRDEMTAGPTDGYQDMDVAATTFKREAVEQSARREEREATVDEASSERRDRLPDTETGSH